MDGWVNVWMDQWMNRWMNHMYFIQHLEVRSTKRTVTATKFISQTRTQSSSKIELHTVVTPQTAQTTKQYVHRWKLISIGQDRASCSLWSESVVLLCPCGTVFSYNNGIASLQLDQQSPPPADFQVWRVGLTLCCLLVSWPRHSIMNRLQLPEVQTAL